MSIELGEPFLDVEFFVDGFEDEVVTVFADADFLAKEAERLGQADGLTAAVHENFANVVGNEGDPPGVVIPLIDIIL